MAMDNGQPEIDDHLQLQDDINAEDILDDVLGGGDVIDDFHSLKGMISGALRSLGYKFSILVVLLFNLLTLHTMRLLEAQKLKCLLYPLTTVAVIPVIRHFTGPPHLVLLHCGCCS